MRQRGQVIPLDGDAQACRVWGIRVPLKEKGKDGRHRTHYETIRGKTELQATKYKDSLLAQIDAGLFFKTAPLTVLDLTTEWLTQKKRGKLKPDSIETYERVVDIYINPHIGHLKLKDLRGTTFRDLYNTLQDAGLSTGTLKYVRRIVGMIMKDAKLWGYIKENPAEGISPPEGAEGRETKSLDLEGALRFVEACYQDFYIGLIFVFAMATGMRPKEYRGIRWSNIKLIPQEVVVDGEVKRIERGLAEVRQIAVKPKGRDWIFPEPKTKKSIRDIPFPAQLYHDLIRFRQEQLRWREAFGPSWHDHGLVFTCENGNPTDDNTLKRWFQTLCRRAELQGFTPYSLRYTYATLQMLAGERDKVISDTMGHVKINFNRDVYQKVLPVMKENSSDKLERLLFSGARTLFAQSDDRRVM